MTPNTHLHTTLARVLTNSINYPQPDRLLGRDLSKLINAATDAVAEAGYVRMEPSMTAKTEIIDLLNEEFTKDCKADGPCDLPAEIADVIIAAGYVKVEPTK